MSRSARPRRVTDPLEDKARARLVGGHGLFSYVSSGSEHSADESPCLSELVHGFLEDDDSESHSLGCESDSDRVDPVADRVDLAEDILRLTVVSNLDSYGKLLYAHVSEAMEAYSCLWNQKSVFRRKVMTFLRELGHNAAVCKTKWDASGGLTAGNYEFIDVVVQPTSSALYGRYVVDLDFASQFEIARPTSQYEKLLQSLPRAFVGKSEELKKVVKAMCDVAKHSLKSRGLSLPPWRKNCYMQNKWFGPHRRTVNSVPSNSLKPVVAAVNGVKCRCVGFDDAIYGQLVVRMG